MSDAKKLTTEELRKVCDQYPNYTFVPNQVGNLEAFDVRKVLMGYIDAQTGKFVGLDGAR